jgi:hypothetical protein
MPHKVKVLEITEVHITAYRSIPPKLLIEAKATVPTSGYTKPELVEYKYIQPTPDGIYDFDFYAKPPTGASADVISSISASYIMLPMPRDLKGVRIHASRNSKVARLSQAATPTTICVKGKLTNEGVECQTLRTTDDEIYTLVGELNGFKIGDEVVVCGTIADISFCMQGTTINVSWIGKGAPRAL